MIDAIAALVTSLGDFPLNPDAGKAWLWSGGGDRLLWASPAARAETPSAGGAADAALVRSFAPLLALAEPHREPIRVHQLAPGGARTPVQTCLCRHVPLRDGGFGLLAVAIGAPARSLEEIATDEAQAPKEVLPSAVEPEAPPQEAPPPAELAPVPGEPVAADLAPAEPAAADRVTETVLAEGSPDESPAHVMPEGLASELGGEDAEEVAAVMAGTEAIEPEPSTAAVASVEDDKAEALAVAEPPAEPHSAPEPPPEPAAPEPVAPEPAAAQPPPAPAWTADEPADRSPLRFVWQTDVAGRFIHISRELAAAVGPGRAMLLGRSWEDFAAEIGIAEAASVAAGFRSGDTWTAAAALWPVEGAALGVPVEMAGLKVLEAGRFDGFRGYGIARIERAVPMVSTAAEALADEASADEAEADEPSADDAEAGISPEEPAPEAAVEPEAQAALLAEAAPDVHPPVPGPAAPGSEPAPEAEPVAARETLHVVDHADEEQASDDEAADDAEATGESDVEPVAVAAMAEPEAPASPPDASEPAPPAAGPRDLRKAAPPSAQADTTAEHAEPAHRPKPLPLIEPQTEPAAAMEPLEPALPLFEPPPAAAETPSSPAAAEAVSPLSAAEREAFREIARALGAMTENLGRPAPRDAGAAARDVRPLEILKRDIVRLAQPAEAAAPVDLERARRERQGRSDSLPDPLQAAAATLLDAAPAGLLVVQDGEPVYANRALVDLAGHADFESFKAEGGAGFLFQRGAPDAPSDLRRFEIGGRDGESVAVEASLTPIEWNGGPAALTVIRPLVEAAPPRQKALELELRAAQAELRELRSVLDTATDGVILLDGEGRILSLNRSAEALFGYDQNEIAGERLTALLEPDSHVAALDYLEGLKSNGVNSILNDGRDVSGRERNGGAIPLFMTIGRIGEREGGAKFCAVLRDVTHWKKVEADLLEAKRAAEDANAHKSDFLAKISHEIRTPLNAIIGFSQVMLAESFGPIGNERYRQYAKDIHGSGEHVVSLVNDLLDLSKIAAGRLELSFGGVDVNAVVSESVAMIQPQANSGKVIVRSQLAADLPAVVADERSLRQIMLNLLSNAAKFTEAGGQVVASTSLTDAGEVVVRVSDTGIGMGEEEVRRALEPFRQIPGPRASGGTGLGLPLTKALVEANRAAFAIRSEPRKGTLVEVTFPSTRVLAE